MHQYTRRVDTALGTMTDAAAGAVRRCAYARRARSARQLGADDFLGAADPRREREIEQALVERAEGVTHRLLNAVGRMSGLKNRSGTGTCRRDEHAVACRAKGGASPPRPFACIPRQEAGFANGSDAAHRALRL